MTIQLVIALGEEVPADRQTEENQKERSAFIHDASQEYLSIEGELMRRHPQNDGLRRADRQQNRPNVGVSCAVTTGEIDAGDVERGR